MHAAAARPPAPPFRLSRAGATTISVEAPLRSPVGSELGDRIEWLLRRGERSIVLDLSGLADIDAAGAGELIRVLNAVHAASGTLSITCASRHVTQFLERAGLLSLLTSDAPAKAASGPQRAAT
jgi:anti-anti-sigma factor